MLDIDYSDFKNSTAHGTIAHGFKIYGTSPYCYWCTDFHIKNNFILNFSIQILI
nr:MAG TPA: Integrin beta-2 beta2 subunit, hybrid domain [Caudoviricetes sp.]